jgi:glycosyltransferase involved in cell wall biosynthesis
MSEPIPAAIEQRVALLFSPSLQGHRLIYCRVLAQVLSGLGFRVVVAGYSSDPSVATSPLLLDLERQPGVTVRDLGGDTWGPQTLDDLAKVIRQSRADVTILTEADDLISALAERRRWRAPALDGRVVGLFIRSTNYAYGGRSPALARARSRLADRRAGRIGDSHFHERLMARQVSLDAALVLDERFAASHLHSHGWLPDIFREFSAVSGVAAETREWAGRVQSFLRECPARPVVVYAGTSDHRRGYDRLLRLCLEEGGCFLHCGARDEEYERSSDDVRSARAALAERGALLETDGSYLHADTAALFLDAASCVALPYRRHDGSSGAMLQAVAAGRPVLVPDRGLSAWRVRSFGLGEVYREDDEDDFRRCFRGLLERGPEVYQAALRAYPEFYSSRQVRAAVSRAVGCGGEGALLPRQPLGEQAGFDIPAAGT